MMEKKNVIGNGTKTENGNENGSGIGMGTAWKFPELSSIMENVRS